MRLHALAFLGIVCGWLVAAWVVTMTPGGKEQPVSLALFIGLMGLGALLGQAAGHD